VEIPIVFSERRAGESKMSARIALEAAVLVPRLRFGRRRVMRTASASASTETDGLPISTG
jgi:dolichol-phosphate mannosyltransferase